MLLLCRSLQALTISDFNFFLQEFFFKSLKINANFLSEDPYFDSSLS